MSSLLPEKVTGRLILISFGPPPAGRSAKAEAGVAGAAGFTISSSFSLSVSYSVVSSSPTSCSDSSSDVDSSGLGERYVPSGGAILPVLILVRSSVLLSDCFLQ